MCVLNMDFDFEAYREKIAFSKISREIEKKEMRKMIAKTNVLFDRFRGIEKTSISFDDLNSFELDKWYNLNDKVMFKKILESRHKLVFETIMYEGGEFGWHKHDDCSEICEVIEGSLHDAKTETTYEVGQSVLYLPGVEHIPVALIDTKLMVTFNKIQKDGSNT